MWENLFNVFINCHNFQIFNKNFDYLWRNIYFRSRIKLCTPQVVV